MSLELPKNEETQNLQDLKLAVEHLSEMFSKTASEHGSALWLTRSPDSGFVQYVNATEKAKDLIGPDEYAKRMETINQVKVKVDELDKLIFEIISDHDSIKSELEP